MNIAFFSQGQHAARWICISRCLTHAPQGVLVCWVKHFGLWLVARSRLRLEVTLEFQTAHALMDRHR